MARKVSVLTTKGLQKGLLGTLARYMQGSRQAGCIARLPSKSQDAKGLTRLRFCASIHSKQAKQVPKPLDVDRCTGKA